jgi:hypothetical protein
MANLSIPPAEISSVIPRTPARERGLTEAFDILTHQAQSELGNITQNLFFAGDGLQRVFVDGVFGIFRPQTWLPGNLLRISSEVARQLIRLSSLLQPDQLDLAWQELRNKLQVFILVKNLPSILNLPAQELTPLSDLVNRAYSMPSFEALWAVEGLGHYYADLYWQVKGVPEGLLLEKQAAVPAKSLLMLHAGLGLAFADRLLGNLTSEASNEQIRSAVEYFLALCRNNCRTGYLGAAIESLGLVTRDFYPDFVQRVDRQLRHAGPEFLGYYWHGVGRALYFSRQYFLPVLRSVWNGVDNEAHNAPDRLSAMAGLSWGVTMVNLRQPAIVENAVRSYPGHSDLAEGFTNGVISSLMMRTETTPGTSLAEHFYRHRPGNAVLAQTWQKRITEPAQAALEEEYPVLRSHDALDQIFRYQDLAALVSSLENRSTNANSGQFVYQN